METVTVSQAPAVSEAAAVATPPAGGATLATLPSAVQDLTRFFLNLMGSSSLRVVGGVAGVAAPASGGGVQLCPSAPGGGAVAPCAATAVPAGLGGPPSAFAAVPGLSGRQQRQETSRPSRRRRRSSSDGTDRASKKRPRGRSPSPGPSSRRRERPYRSSSEFSEDARAKASPPRAGRALEVLLAIFAPLRRVTTLLVLDPQVGRRSHPRERSVIAQVLVVDPPLLRAWQMTTDLVLSTRLTLTGMTLSGQSWPSSGTSSFPGQYSVPPGVTSITLEKASEARKRSVSLSASQVSSLETMLSGVCEVSSWLDWWLSMCGGFWEHLPDEVRADFERLILSRSRTLEFLASQGCTALGNVVLSRRDSLLADVCSTVPAEEVAVALFPSPLLDSELTKMRAAANDALVQRTLHPSSIPRKPAAAGGSAGSSASGSGQASSSGARPAQKQTSSSPSGQSGKKSKNRKGKASFSSSYGGSGRSGGKGKGAGKKLT